ILALVTATTASGLLIGGNGSPDSKETALADEVSKADEQAARSVESPKDEQVQSTDETPKVEKPASPAEAPKSPSAEAPKAAHALKASPAANTAEERRLLLESVGALTAANCYQTYLNIGLIADGKTKGAYTDKDAYKVLDSVLSLLSSVDRKLAALS